MRTTVTLEPDAEAAIRKLMRERGLTFKQALNDAIRAGTATPRSRPVRFPTYRMGKPLIPLTKALQLAGELEDEELIRKMATGR
ncbi:MAG: antitoxin [Chloroflexi bacterium]|nr:antitoxin [Chloroflexota bacterium]